jgi:hypothetical protein
MLRKRQEFQEKLEVNAAGTNLLGKTQTTQRRTQKLN